MPTKDHEPNATPAAEADDRFYRDTEAIAFPKLDDRQLRLLEPLGRRRKVHAGEMLFKAGQRDVPMTVILHGELEVFEARDGHEQILSSPGPRDFVGDVGMLAGTSAVASARGKADESEILARSPRPISGGPSQNSREWGSRSSPPLSCGVNGCSGTMSLPD